MNAIPFQAEHSAKGRELPQFARTALNDWLKLCDQFSEYQRREIICGNPTEKQLADYRDSLKWALRMLRLILSQANDPDFPDRQFVSAIEGRILQFEEAWAIYGETKMSDAEADEILSRAFPE